LLVPEVGGGKIRPGAGWGWGAGVLGSGSGV